MDSTADAIAARAGGVVAEYTMVVTRSYPSTALSVQSFGPDPGSPSVNEATSGEAVIKIDWSAADGGPLYAVSTAAVADVAADYLLTSNHYPYFQHDLHLIGHSRGGSVMTRFAERLAKRGVWVEQFTTLDPHPVDGFSGGDVFDFGDVPMRVWGNVRFADNYWRADGSDSLDLEQVDFDGEPVAGAHNVQLSESVLVGSGSYLEHSDVHLWYRGTVGPPYPTDTGAVAGWYLPPHPPREGSGYRFSRVAGGDRPVAGLAERFGGAGQRWGVTPDGQGTQWPNVGEVALRHHPSRTLAVGERVFLSYRYQDADTPATVTWFADTNTNPYDDTAEQLPGQQTLAATGSAVVAGRYHASTAGLTPGTRHLYARIADADGHTRYAYLPGAVTLTNTAPAPTLASGQHRTGVIGRDFDVYSFHAAAGDRLLLGLGQVSDPYGDLSPELAVIGPDGSVLAGSWGNGGAAVEVASAPATGTYYVAAFDRYGDGGGVAYTLNLARLPAALSPDDEGGPITSGRSATGFLGNGDHDVYTFAADVGDSIAVALGQGPDPYGDLSPRLDLYGPNGQLLATNWGNTAAGVDLVGAPQAGTYYAVARDYYAGGNGVGYRLTLARLPAAQDAGGDAGAVTSGQAVSGTLGNGDLDVFTFAVNAGDAIVASIGQASDPYGALSPQLDLYGPTGALLRTNWGNTAAAVELLGAPLTGIYYAVTRDRYAGGDGVGYQFTVARLPAAHDAGGDGGAVVSGQPVLGALPNGDLDVFTFVAAAGDAVVLTLGQGNDPYGGLAPRLDLFGPGGARLASNWGNTATTVELLGAPSAGTYHVVVRDQYAGGDNVGYQLGFARLPAAQDAGGDGGPLVSGRRAVASLPGGDLDVFTLSANAGDAIVGAFGQGNDPYGDLAPHLDLFGPNGARLASNWGNAAAQVALTNAPLTGTYYFVARDHYGYGGGVAYGLTAARLPGPQDASDGGGAIGGGAAAGGTLPPGDIDVFTLAASAGNRIAVTLTQGNDPYGDLSPQLDLYGPTGALLRTSWGNGSATVDLPAAPTAGAYHLVVRDAYGFGGGVAYTLATSATVTAPPPSVTALMVNHGEAAQRSMVTSLTATFDQPVALQTGAFALARRNGAGAGVEVSAAASADGGLSYVLSLTGPGLVGGSLPDGVYDLTVVAARVRAVAAPGPAMAADRSFAVHRLFSDADGDGDSDGLDLNQFRLSLNKSRTLHPATYKWYFDFDDSGVVDAADLAQTRTRRNVVYPVPGPTASGTATPAAPTAPPPPAPDASPPAASVDGPVTPPAAPARAVVAFQQAATAEGLVSIQAEAFDGSVARKGKGWQKVTGSTHAAGAAMRATANTGVHVAATDAPTDSPRLDYLVNFVRTGVHYLWVRGSGATAADDSVHAGLDGVVQASSDNVGTGFARSPKWSRATHDGPLATIDVATTGVHTVNLWMREDGFALDKLVLTTSTTYVPTGVGPASSTRATAKAPARA